MSLESYTNRDAPRVVDARRVRIGGRVGMVAARVGGFTLMEVLVALAVFAVVAVLAYGGLQRLLIAREHLAASDRRLAQLQKAMLIMATDFALAAPRSVRDETGTQWPALSGGADSDPGVVLRFTRAGRPNPTGLRQSGLERVVYRFHDHRLERQLWPTLDRSTRTEPLSGVLVDRLSGVRVRFADVNGSAAAAQRQRWLLQWPPGSGQASGDALPAGVEVKLTIEDLGTVRRVFVLPGHG